MKKLNFPKRISRKIIYKNSWINLYADKVLLPSGKIIEKYHFLDFPKESIVVLLQNNKKEILFIKSLRYVTGKIELELPAGSIEKGENILMAAKREVEEETGYEVKSLKSIYSFNPSNGMGNQIVHVVFAKTVSNLRKDFDTDEIRSGLWLDKSQVEKLIKQKKISCGVSLIPILLYLNH